MTKFEKLLYRQRQELTSHYDDHDPAVDRFIHLYPNSRVNALKPNRGGELPGIPPHIMGKLLSMDVNKSYYKRASLDETAAFGWPRGGMDNDEDEEPGSSTDASAFYMPFHSYPNHWGIYLYLHGIHCVRRGLKNLFQAYSITRAEDQITIANEYLYFHELMHHKVESFALRVEAVLNLPFYLEIKSPRYTTLLGLGKQQRHLPNPSEWCYEETCAESFAREQILARKEFRGRRQNKSASKLARELINDFLRCGSPSYREAAKTDREWDGDDPSRVTNAVPLVAIRSRMYEDYLSQPYSDHKTGISWNTTPLRQRSLSAWGCAWGFGTKFDEPVGLQALLSHRTFYLERV